MIVQYFEITIVGRQSKEKGGRKQEAQSDDSWVQLGELSYIYPPRVIVYDLTFVPTPEHQPTTSPTAPPPHFIKRGLSRRKTFAVIICWLVP